MCVRTLVIDGVTHGKDSEDGGKDRSSGRVLSVEVLGLQSSKARLRGWSLGKFRVEVDEGGKASSRSSGLHRRNRKKKKKTRVVSVVELPSAGGLTYEEGWGSDLWWDDTAKLATNEGGLHNYSEESMVEARWNKSSLNVRLAAIADGASQPQTTPNNQCGWTPPVGSAK